jgi:flavin-dependent dehydrogenase
MKPVAIAGGGLAGLVLGIRLRLAGVPVTVLEAGSYPRHKVCGEFLSGRGLGLLRDGDVLGSWVDEECVLARTIAVYDGDRLVAVRALPAPAACVPRFRLDAHLAARFRELGGTLVTQSRVADGTGRPGLVLATGRRRRAGKPAWHWFGVKMHLPDPGLHADLELHFLEHAYVGLCRVGRSTANVCGLVRRRPSAALPTDPREPERLLWGPPGGQLHRRLSGTQPLDGSLVTVAGLDFGRGAEDGSTEFRIGDCLTMTPPFTGNGMSMAIESGWAAAPALIGYSGGVSTWDEARQTAAATNHRLFGARLRWARALHRALWHPAARHPLLRLGAASPGLWRALFGSTR